MTKRSVAETPTLMDTSNQKKHTTSMPRNLPGTLRDPLGTRTTIRGTPRYITADKLRQIYITTDILRQIYYSI